VEKSYRLFEKRKPGYGMGTFPKFYLEQEVESTSGTPSHQSVVSERSLSDATSESYVKVGLRVLSCESERKGRREVSNEISIKNKNKNKLVIIDSQGSHAPAANIRTTKDGRYFVHFWPRTFAPIQISSRRDGKKLVERLGIVETPSYKNSKKTRVKSPIQFQLKLKYEFPHRYFFIITFIQKKKIKPILQPSDIHACGNDPNISNFITNFNTAGEVNEYGMNCSKDSKRANNEISKFQSLADRAKKANRTKMVYRLKKRMAVWETKLKNWRRDLHWKLANELCTKYTHILHSKLRTKQIAASLQLSKESKDILYNLGHYTFTQRLQSKAESTGTHLHYVNEHYSTIGCPNCGWNNRQIKVGINEFKCSQCNTVAPRDWKASYIIFMMNIERCVATLRC